MEARVILIDGKRLARDREELLKTRVDQFIQKTGRKPTLVALELSDDPGSRLYLKLKKAAAERTGIEFSVFKRAVFSVLKGQSFQRFNGIFIQHPPRQKLQEIAVQYLGGQAGLSRDRVDRFWLEIVDQIPPEKDVDCLTSENLRLIKKGKPRFLPATVKAVIYCVQAVENVGQVVQVDQAKKKHDVPDSTCSTCSTCTTFRTFLKEKHIVILGRSPIVGLPLSWWLSNLGGDITLLHSETSGLALRASCLTADILISTVGKPGLVSGDMVKEGAIVIDCGSPSGDVVFNEVAPKASAITPVPGGVGPLTVVSLMENVIQSLHLTTRSSS